MLKVHYPTCISPRDQFHTSPPISTNALYAKSQRLFTSTNHPAANNNNNNSNNINDTNNTTHHHTNINTSNTRYVKTPNTKNIDNGITSVASNIHYSQLVIAVDGNTNDGSPLYPLYHTP